MNKKNILALLLVAFLAVPVAGLAVGAAPDVGVVEVITDIINVLFFILVSVAAIFIILGAFTILTAQGDAEKMGTGRTQITYAIVAVVVAIAAQGIIAFIRAHIAA